VRRVTQAESRLKEAAKLGFRRALAPQATHGGSGRKSRAPQPIDGLALTEVGHLQEMIDWLYNESQAGSVPKRSGVASA
jgi:DNA repair protein RadA/Sms